MTEYYKKNDLYDYYDASIYIVCKINNIAYF